MDREHTVEFDEKNAFVIPKVEVSLDDSECSSSNDNAAESDNTRIGASDNDPLLLVMKEETETGADTEINRILLNEICDEEFLVEENSIEK